MNGSKRLIYWKLNWRKPISLIC
uniref:Uncharacterized protein n=1 Tax=Arundo donax TaxID=35708 RepID=A0A0A9EC95_ARUDO